MVIGNLGLVIALLALARASPVKHLASVAQQVRPPPHRASPRTVDGRFARYLEAPDGQVDGVVLEDGTVARFAPHPRVFEISPLREGDAVHVQGDVVRGVPGPYLVHASLRRGGVLQNRDVPANEPQATPNAGQGANPSVGSRTQADDILFVKSPRLAPKRDRVRMTAHQLKRLTTGRGRDAVNSRWSRRREDDGP